MLLFENMDKGETMKFQPWLEDGSLSGRGGFMVSRASAGEHHPATARCESTSRGAGCSTSLYGGRSFASTEGSARFYSHAESQHDLGHG